jgi:hypothetical protein
VNHLVGGAAEQQPSQVTTAMRPHHDRPGPVCLGAGDNLAGGVPEQRVPDVGTRLNASPRQLVDGGFPDLTVGQPRELPRGIENALGNREWSIATRTRSYIAVLALLVHANCSMGEPQSRPAETNVPPNVLPKVTPGTAIGPCRCGTRADVIQE